MPKPLESYESRSFRFACAVVRLYLSLNNSANVPVAIARQFLRAGTSIGANIEEAQGAQTRKDKATKFSIALKEARETSYWLRLMSATSLVPQSAISALLAEANELVAIFTVTRRKLNTKGTKVPKNHSNG